MTLVNNIPTLDDMIATAARNDVQRARRTVTSAMQITDVTLFGASHGANGNISGGGGYSQTYTTDDADTIVTTLAELVAALSSASDGDIIYVDGVIDITAAMASGDHLVIDTANVKLVGDRGVDGSLGGCIYNRNRNAFSGTTSKAIEVTAAGVEISGLRLYGPDWGRDYTYHEYSSFNASQNHYNYYSTRNVHNGIQSSKSNTHIHNCDIAGWSWSGIHLASDTASATTGNVVEYNNIHHCQHTGLGYGVSLDIAQVIARYNYLNHTRHSIAGTGDEEEEYSITDNVFGLHQSSHVVDMHDKSGEGGSNLACTNNTFFVAGPGLQVANAAMVARFRGTGPQSGTFNFYSNYCPRIDSGAGAYENAASSGGDAGENYYRDGKVTG